MKNSKPLLRLLLLCSLLPTAPAAQDARTGEARAGAQTSNRQPRIERFEASESSVVSPCLKWRAGTWFSPKLTIELTAKAIDADGDKVRYEYAVSGGRITGEGEKVSWDLTGQARGSYQARVTASDGRGGVESVSFEVVVLEPIHCDVPCATVSVSNPEEVLEGQPVTFSANISGLAPEEELSLVWAVSAGRIIKGAGTPVIEVDTHGLGGQNIVATLELGGYPPECHHKVGGQTQVRRR